MHIPSKHEAMDASRVLSDELQTLDALATEAMYYPNEVKVVRLQEVRRSLANLHARLCVLLSTREKCRRDLVELHMKRHLQGPRIKEQGITCGTAHYENKVVVCLTKRFQMLFGVVLIGDRIWEPLRLVVYGHVPLQRGNVACKPRKSHPSLCTYSVQPRDYAGDLCGLNFINKIHENFTHPCTFDESLLRELHSLQHVIQRAQLHSKLGDLAYQKTKQDLLFTLTLINFRLIQAFPLSNTIIETNRSYGICLPAQREDSERSYGRYCDIKHAGEQREERYNYSPSVPPDNTGTYPRFHARTYPVPQLLPINHRRLFPCLGFYSGMTRRNWLAEAL